MLKNLLWQFMPGPLLNSVSRPLSNYGRKQKSFETYYDILQVSKNCTSKEIRSAFVCLSKKFHPDTKGSKACPDETAKFVKISEAYQTLSRPRLRNAYDQKLWARGVDFSDCYRTDSDREANIVEVNRSWEIHPSFEQNPGPYYGVEGWEKVSNSKIAWSLLALAVGFAAIGFLSAKHSFTFDRERLDKKSQQASQHLETVRSDARKYGNEEQVQRMFERMAQNAER